MTSNMEKLIRKSGKKEFPLCVSVSASIENSYRVLPNTMRTFIYQYEYYFDGRVFLFGHFEGQDRHTLIESETGASAVKNKGFSTPQLAIAEFKRLLGLSGKTIHEVIRDFKNRNVDLETWLINSLNM